MRCWIAGFLLVCGQFAGAKTKMLVEDPNNVVAGRYSYDTQCHRIIHGRLYTVTELPRVQEYGRFDDDTAVYLGGANGFSKEGYRK